MSMNTLPLPTSLPPPPPLSRTSSSTSFSSEDDNASMSSSTVTVISSSRRTRKRFTNAQLTMLENLFHQNSHPSREDREAVASAGGMEIKSVTIWFQNKRQTERKTAANNATMAGTGTATNASHYGATSSNVVPNITSTIHTFSLHHPTSRTASPPFSVSSRSSGGGSTPTTTATASRLSLDRVASRTELRAAAPRTPRRANPAGAIWDNMPSSPLAPPISPPAREFIELGGKNTKTRRTLEWACAAARLADKDGYASGMTSGFGGSGGGGSAMSVSSASSSTSSTSSSRGGRGRSVPKEWSTHGRIEKTRHRRDGPSSNNTRDVDMELTEDEDDEAITPPSTWDKDDRRWVSTNEGRHHSLMTMTSVASGGPLPKGVDDDDMFKAALALCGLGRRT